MVSLRNIAVNGANGKMGREVVRGILASPDYELVGAVDVSGVGGDIGTLAGLGPCGIDVTGDLGTLLRGGRVEAVIDFTTPRVVMTSIRVSLEHGVPIVVGTTGVSEDDVDEVRRLSNQHQTNAIVAPNFTIGAVLMMLFSQTAAKYFDNVEIIELHHNKKMDAPSGTAIKTAEMILSARQGQPSPPPGEFETIDGARGGDMSGVRLHAVRLPGFIAHQEVIFGDSGQILTIRHDSMSRECYVPGVLMAVKKLSEISGVVYGLENLL